MPAAPVPAPQPDVTLTVTVSRAGGGWQARVERPDRPGAVVFTHPAELAAYLWRCRPAGLR